MRKAVLLLTLLVVAVLAACQQATPSPTEAPPSAPEPSSTPATEARVQPAVEVQDQKPMDGQVTIDKVVAEKDGWIVIHIEKDGKPGPIIGYAPVKAGENTNIQVTIDLEKATETLFAMLHVDEGQMGTYEFPNGPDVPVKVGDKVVVKPFKIEMSMEEGAGENGDMGGGMGGEMGGGMEGMPMIEVQDQKPMDGQVTIDKVVAEKDGWIVIHIEKDGKPGPIIGYAPVKAGENTNIQVTIDLEKATETLFAMLHVDEGQMGTYEFPNGPDVPVKVGDKVVVKPFKLLQGEGEASETTGNVVEVQILNYAYSPMELEVKVGTTVTWTNMDYVPHTVTADNGAFDSGMMANGAQFSFTFNEPGTYTYICTYHPNMTGTVVVVP